MDNFMLIDDRVQSRLLNYFICQREWLSDWKRQNKYWFERTEKNRGGEIIRHCLAFQMHLGPMASEWNPMTERATRWNMCTALVFRNTEVENGRAMRNCWSQMLPWYSKMVKTIAWVSLVLSGRRRFYFPNNHGTISSFTWPSRILSLLVTPCYSGKYLAPWTWAEFHDWPSRNTM